MFGGIPLSEIDELKEYWEAFPTLKEEMFTNSEIPYVELATKDIKQTIKKTSLMLSILREI